MDQLAQLFMSKGWRGQTQGLMFITGAYGISSQSLWDVYAIDVFQLDFIWDTSMKQHPHKRKHHAMRRRGQALTRVGGQEHTVPTPAADTSGFQSRRNASGAVCCLFFRLFFFFFLNIKAPLLLGILLCVMACLHEMRGMLLAGDNTAENTRAHV